jgi:hypothetical protein
MCRLMAYIGHPMLVADVVLWPDRSVASGPLGTAPCTQMEHLHTCTPAHLHTCTPAHLHTCTPAHLAPSPLQPHAPSGPLAHHHHQSHRCLCRRSIIKQSYDAKERKQDPSLPMHLGFGNLNGDGFGIGWFSPDERREADPSPCVFTSITPAW